MEPELPPELLNTLVGMRNAGADRAAVVQRLQAEGVSAEVAGPVVDQIDAQIAQRHGARPADMRADIASQADAAREANLAATGLVAAAPHTPAATEPVEAGTIAVVKALSQSGAGNASETLRAAEAKLITDGHNLLMAGLTTAALRQQWTEAGLPEHTALRLVESAQGVRKQYEQNQRESRRRITRVAVALMAVVAVLGLVGIFLMLQGPSGQERASQIALAACGSDDPRVLETNGQVVLLAGEGLNVGNSLDIHASEFNNVFLQDDDVRPEYVLCSSVDLLAIELCGGYFELPSTTQKSSGTQHTVRIRGSRLTVQMLDISTFQHVNSVQVAVGPGSCPTTYRGDNTRVNYPDAQQGLTAIRELVATTNR